MRLRLLPFGMSCMCPRKSFEPQRTAGIMQNFAEEIRDLNFGQFFFQQLLVVKIVVVAVQIDQLFMAA